jgi:catechol 2,3-dioxygenase-like lactoylglutathione lyase family enzyme
MKMKLELVPVPVSDDDRSKAFYVDKLGFNADHDFTVNENLRFIQLTSSGSACSIVIGKGTTEMKPGSQKRIQFVIENAQAAHDELKAKGVDVSDVDVQAWGKFVYVTDPDGNTLALQEPIRPDQ